MFERFVVELEIRDKIYGTLPGNKEVFNAWMTAKFEDPDNTENTATDLDLDEEMEKNTNQFRRDDNGLYLGSYQLKAMIAQAGSLLELTTKKRGSKQTLKEATFIKGLDEDGKMTNEKVYLLPLRDKADGQDSFTGTVTGPQGSRSIISNSEFCLRPTLRFQMWILGNRLQADNRGKKLTVEDYQNILEFGGELGLGAHRNMEKGKFTCLQFDPIS